MHQDRQFHYLILPCYNGLGEKIKRMGRAIGFEVYFKSAASPRSIVKGDKIRPVPNEELGDIYEIKCACSASYVAGQATLYPTDVTNI
ncbi:hypothetical protein M513_11016 [Trichuris suis]|uniref:Uncharacterized protein n=1 Tax=Trichuris suis TaxID=68888 RepID=A0A085LSX7_9BILA|nr:hypothetical protein M513_11016 [Trichuris suis]